MEDYILRVKCPVCLKKDGEENTKDNLILLGDEEQNMQCLGCGYGSNNNMKEHISDNPFPQEFKDVCRKMGIDFGHHPYLQQKIIKLFLWLKRKS